MQLLKSGCVAIVGLLAPYIISICMLIANRKMIGNHDYYLSGNLAKYNERTSIIDLSACFCGAILWLPWCFKKLSKSMSVFFCGILILLSLIGQIVFVFTLRLFVYIQLGGIFP
jgi:hypothetical protein